jgi:hypothetical protein
MTQWRRNEAVHERAAQLIIAMTRTGFPKVDLEARAQCCTDMSEICCGCRQLVEPSPHHTCRRKYEVNTLTVVGIVSSDVPMAVIAEPSTDRN